jgi:hypothetical protein
MTGISLSERLYAQLLRLYPPGYRRRYGPLMLQLFRDQYRDARRASARLGRWQLWWRVAAELGHTAAAEHLAECKEGLMPNEANRQSAARVIGLLVASVLIAGSLIAKSVIFEFGGSTALALGVLLAAHLAAGLLIDWLMGTRGLAFLLMTGLIAATLLPLLWVPDGRAWLRENPLIGGIFVVIFAGWYHTGRPRWPLYVVAAILAVSQILVSFI